jgi:A/G-specific adenine glycosylase
MSRSTPKTAQDTFFVKASLLYFKKVGRKLPWRKTRQAYPIWVSEVMLQQTQVARGQEYYERFLKAFPNIQSLAKSSWPSLLRVWRGLGYYQRAKNMRSAAQQIIQFHKGRFPKDRDSLLQLPGVGPYTADAILSFAFGEARPAVDTNIRRVISRFFGIPQQRVMEKAEKIFALQSKSSRDLNQALMDIGATICKSKKALCQNCPLAQHCASTHLANELSEGKSKTERGSKRLWIDVGVACIHQEGSFLLGKRPRSKDGLWEFPGGKREKGEDIRQCLKREIKEELGVEVAVRPAFFVYEVKDRKPHPYRLHFCRCQILRGKPKALEHEKLKWIPAKELLQYPTLDSNAAAFKKLSRM